MGEKYTEKAFETAIEDHLLAKGGFSSGDRETYDPLRCFFSQDVISFIRETQPKQWEYLKGLQKEKAEEMLLDDLCRALNSEHEGCLNVLRHGFKCFGKDAYFAQPSGLNLDIKRFYDAKKIVTLPKCRYAVIVDEAHSSQGGADHIRSRNSTAVR